MKLSFHFTFVILFLIVGCERDAVIETKSVEATVNKSYPNVDERLWSFFQSFEEEARARGLSFDLKDLNILGEVVNIDQDGVAGHCKFGSHIDNEVTIDSKFWSRASDVYKEFIVFHELGHCVLLRGHDENILDDGTCQSLMRSGVENCRDNYSVGTRTRYIDELFSENNL